jgi:hypothetical protein
MSVEFFGDLVDRPNERVRRRQHVGAGEHRNGADNSYKTVNDISVIMCCTSASSAWSRSAFAYAALFALPDVRVTQMTDITCPKAHVPTHVVDLRQLPRPRPPGHRLDPDVEHLRDLGWRKEFVSFGHGYPRSSARFGSDAAANAIGLDLCAARVGPAVNVLLGERRRAASRNARCRTTHVEDVATHVRSVTRLVVAKTFVGRAGHLVPVALTKNAPCRV